MLPNEGIERGANNIVASRENVTRNREAMKLKTISREEQLEKLRRRYGSRGSEGKSRILDELCEQHGYHRKHAIRLLNGAAVPREIPAWAAAAV